MVESVNTSSHKTERKKLAHTECLTFGWECLKSDWGFPDWHMALGTFVKLLLTGIEVPAHLKIIFDILCRKTLNSNYYLAHQSDALENPNGRIDPLWELSITIMASWPQTQTKLKSRVQKIHSGCSMNQTCGSTCSPATSNQPGSSSGLSIAENRT